MKRNIFVKGSDPIRLSVLKRIALLFLVALVFSAVPTILLSYNYLLLDAAEQGEDIARVVALAAHVAIGSRKI